MRIFERFPMAKFINHAQKKDLILIGSGLATGDCEIGEDVALNDALIDITGGVKIGDRVHFGQSVMILSCSHPVDEVNGLRRRKMYRCGKICIKQDAYIGSRAIILDGVTIGESAYIAAGAIVTKNVPDFELWGGVPAKVIRKIKHDRI